MRVKAERDMKGSSSRQSRKGVEERPQCVGAGRECCSDVVLEFAVRRRCADTGDESAGGVLCEVGRV